MFRHSLRREHGWLLVAAGLVAGILLAVMLDRAAQPATAQADRVAVTPQQLLINQRISQAGVRRSNEALALLGPVRGDDAPGFGTGQIADGAITSSKLAAGVSTAGPTGPQGPTGPTGPPGEPAVSLFAVVDFQHNGIVRGSPGITFDEGAPDNGRVDLIFDRSLAQCAYVAGVSAEGPPGPGAPAGEARVEELLSGGTTLRVVTADSAGSAAERAFHVIVTC